MILPLLSNIVPDYPIETVSTNPVGQNDAGCEEGKEEWILRLRSE